MASSFCPDGTSATRPELSSFLTLALVSRDDGKIRAYMPQSGKLKFEINNAHNKGVTALAFTNDCTRIISGGGDGQVRDVHTSVHVVV